MKIQSFSPSNNKLIGTVDITTDKEIAEAIKKAKMTQTAWANFPLQKRLEHMKNLSGVFAKNQEQLAKQIAEEMGMPINEARGDVESGLNYLNWYIDNAEKCLQDDITFQADGETHRVIYEPKGVVASIVPWNFPFSNFVWQGCQNLIVGNAVIMKHSELTPICSKLIADLVAKSTLPKNVFTMVYGDGVIGEKLAKSNIDHICFTGSTAVGKQLYKIAAENFISIGMELGGSAAGIVFVDADIDNVLDSIFLNKFSNCGQICDGLKRLIVHKDKFEEVVEKLKIMTESKKVGNALSEDTEIGPLVSVKQLDILVEQVKSATDSGAKIIAGGKKLDIDNGNFYSPTLLTNINTKSKIWTEEVFGPALPIVQFKTIEEAIQLANNTRYGLGGYVFTEDKKLFERVSKDLKTGMVSWNNCVYVIPQNPFGGTKESGLGRNHGKWGFHELCNVKVVTF